MFRIEFLPGDARDAGYLWRNGRIAVAEGDEPFRALIHDWPSRSRGVSVSEWAAVKADARTRTGEYVAKRSSRPSAFRSQNSWVRPLPVQRLSDPAENERERDRNDKKACPSQTRATSGCDLK